MNDWRWNFFFFSFGGVGVRRVGWAGRRERLSSDQTVKSTAWPHCVSYEDAKIPNQIQATQDNNNNNNQKSINTHRTKEHSHEQNLHAAIVRINQRCYVKPKISSQNHLRWENNGRVTQNTAVSRRIYIYTIYTQGMRERLMNGGWVRTKRWVIRPRRYLHSQPVTGMHVYLLQNLYCHSQALHLPHYPPLKVAHIWIGWGKSLHTCSGLLLLNWQAITQIGSFKTTTTPPTTTKLGWKS